MPALTDTQLGAIVSRQIQLAKSHDKHEREGDRTKALDYFLGRMNEYVKPEAGRSKVVSRDVADTIGWMLPGIIRVFTASDRMAIAEPVEEQDTEFAKQATDGLNYVFWKENRGYETIYSATWDSLLVGNGIVKTWYDDTPIYATSLHSGLTEDQLAVLLQPDDDGEAPEVLALSPTEAMIPDPMSGEMVSGLLFDVKLRRKKDKGRFVIEAIAPEKFLTDDAAITTEDAAFTAHWEQKTRSELVGMGYDRNEVASIPAAGRNESPEEQARIELMASEDAADKSTELVDYFECFVRIDVDDDGEAELVRVCAGGSDGGTLLDWEVWEDEHPFDDIPCEPIPHRWSARSIADETMDVQDIKTVLLRQALNNVYATNNPQRFVTGKIENPDELVSPTFGGVVFGGPGATVLPLEVPFVANHAFEAIAYQDEVVQRRTGVGRSSMALDPEALQNQTATANQNQRDAAYSQIELVARNMAEWGWRKVFRKLLRLMIKHQDVPRVLMMNGKPVKIDPRFWNADMDVTINVGLGTGSRDRDMLMLQQVLGTQLSLADRFVDLGNMDDAIDLLPKILRTMVKMAESAGIRNPEEFYPEYTEEKVAQLKQMAAERAQQPPPEVMKEKAKLEAQAASEQMRVQLDAEKERIKAEGAAFKEKVQAEANTAEAQARAQMDLEKDRVRVAFEQQKHADEMAFRERELDQKLEIELMKLGGQIAQQEQAAAPQPGDGKAPAKPKARAMPLSDAIRQMGETLAAVQEMVSAPRQIVRDETGRAVGVQVGKTLRRVERDADGRAMGLQ